MTLFDLFKRRGSAPVARERLQVLLAYERKSRNQPDLVALLREEIMAVITKHIQVDQDDVHVTMDRGETMSTLEIDIHIRNADAMAAVAAGISGTCRRAFPSWMPEANLISPADAEQEDAQIDFRYSTRASFSWSLRPSPRCAL